MMNISDALTIVLVAAMGAFVGPFIKSFFGKKAENLATKQDIAEITKRQEEIKHRFNELIELSKQRHSLRTLVADKRMEAHQQAFKRVKQLLFAREDVRLIAACNDWMDDHCLYLTADARTGMWKAIGFAESRAHLLAEGRSDGIEAKFKQQYHDEAVKAWHEIASALPPIMSAVELPPMGIEELNIITRGSDPS